MVGRGDQSRQTAFTLILFAADPRERERSESPLRPQRRVPGEGTPFIPRPFFWPAAGQRVLPRGEPLWAHPGLRLSFPLAPKGERIGDRPTESPHQLAAALSRRNTTPTRVHNQTHNQTNAGHKTLVIGINLAGVCW